MISDSCGLSHPSVKINLFLSNISMELDQILPIYIAMLQIYGNYIILRRNRRKKHRYWMQPINLSRWVVVWEIKLILGKELKILTPCFWLSFNTKNHSWSECAKKKNKTKRPSNWKKIGPVTRLKGLSLIDWLMYWLIKLGDVSQSANRSCLQEFHGAKSLMLQTTNIQNRSPKPWTGRFFCGPVLRVFKYLTKNVNS